MQLHQKTLKNGLRLKAVAMPGTNVVTTLVLVGAGSKFETKENTGISHFLEHMFFKGAKKYQTPKAVAEAVDSFGGEFNAFTGKEYAGYYVKSGQQNLATSLEVLSDMLLHATFPTAEIEKERGVILEEMAMYQDAPMYQISWDFERLVFGDQPLGWEQIGTPKVVNSVTQDQFKAYQKALYTPENMVVVCAGAVNQDTLDQMADYFAMPEQTRALEPTPFDPRLQTERVNIRVKKTEQYHLSIGVPTFGEDDPRFPVLKVLAVILGGNMSSRMFQNVREEKGLCYSVRTSVDEYSEAGLVTTRAGVKLTDVERAIEAIMYEYKHIATGGVTEKELEKAKNYLIGKTDLSTEDTEDIAHEYAKNALLYNKIESVEDWKAQVASVELKAVNQLAKELFVTGNFRLAGIGSGLETSKALEIIDS